MNRHLPKVTVVIPSYNHERYVIETIDSVLNQSYPNIELIVIDDGSTDNSATLIDAHQRRSGQYQFIAQGNQGLIQTLSYGLNLAQGGIPSLC